MITNTKKQNIIMIGPDLDVQGGIPSVVNMYFDGGLAQRVNLKFIYTHKDGSTLKKIFVFIGAIFRIIWAFLTIKSPVVHIHTSQDGSFFRKYQVLMLAKIFGKKTIIHVHGSQFERFMHKNALNTFLTRHMFNTADCVLVLSDVWKKIVEDFAHPKKVVTLYNPATLHQKPEKTEENVTVLFLGRLGERKGVYDLMSSIIDRQELFRSSKARFVLAGDGDVEAVRGLVQKNGLTDIVDVPGWVSGGKKQELINSSDILALPSYNEQMPMSVLEAMGYGTPIVATRVAGIPEMVEEAQNGYLFDPGDVKALDTSLLKLCQDGALRKHMGARSREIVQKKFEIQVILGQLVGIYNDLN